MPIKSLESLLFESKLVHSSSISVLQNATIGIDVEHYLSRIYTFKKEQYLYGIGGAPSSLSAYINSDVKVFNEFNIRPIFVFPGLPITEEEQAAPKNRLTPQEQHLEATWARLNSKHSMITGPQFGYLGESFRLNLDPLPIGPMINDIVSLLIENGIDYIISPYNASFQLSYMYQNGLIDSIYGSTDTLLTMVDKFILGMEFQSKDFRYVDKQKVLTEFNLTERQFLDLSIMVGCSAQLRTFSNLPSLLTPNHMQPIQHLGYFRIALDIFFQYVNFKGTAPHDLLDYISTLNDPHLVNLYKRGHAAIKYMPVINSAGQVELFLTEMAKLGLVENNDIIHEQLADKNITDVGRPRIPSDLHSVISQRLPSEIYFYQSLGLIPIKLLEAITLGAYFVRTPLDLGGVQACKRLVSSTLFQTILDAQFNMLTLLLARYYQVKRIKVFYWFKEEPFELNSRQIPPVSDKLSNLNFVYDKSDKFQLKDFWKCVTSSSAITNTESSVNSQSLVATSFLRVLSLMGVVDEKGILSRYGQILLSFISNCSDISNGTIEQLLLIYILCLQEKDSLFNNDISLLSVPKSLKEDSTGQELSSEESQAIGLISRIFTLQKLNICPINYQGPISRSLLSFRSQVKFIQETIQHTLQVCLVDLIVREEKVKLETESKNDWYNIVAQIPFFDDLSNTLLGVMSEIFFEYCLRLKKSGKPNADCINGGRSHLLDTILQVGKPSYNINLNSVNSVSPLQFDLDFKAALQLWNYFRSFSQAMSEADVDIFTCDDMKVIEKADAIVRNFTE